MLCHDSIVGTVNTESYWFDFCLWLVGASLHWLVLGLAIPVINLFCYDNADQLRTPIKKMYFLRKSKQIKLPVLDAHGIQIT